MLSVIDHPTQNPWIRKIGAHVDLNNNIELRYIVYSFFGFNNKKLHNMYDEVHTDRIDKCMGRRWMDGWTRRSMNARKQVCPGGYTEKN